MNLQELKNKSLPTLLEHAIQHNVENPHIMRKQDLVFSILKKVSEADIPIFSVGVLEVLQDGFGFLRSPESNYLPGPDDIYVAPAFIKKLGLKTGDTIECQIKAPKEIERYFSVLKILKVNFDEIDNIKRRTNFDNLTPLYPEEMLTLESLNPASNSQNGMTQRIIDLVSPIGKGQRALIVAPPRTGKTVMLQTIAQSITARFPDIYLIVLLIDERPEEVTDMQRSVKGEVVSSTFDEPAARHVQVTEMVIEKAKRLVEHKRDVVILLDSITRLARAYNTVVPSSGKVLTGGVDSNALQRPKRFFGAARNIEEGGSLTIIATALVETGSRMDDVIFEEFKGTGNSEIVLDRKLSDKRVFPAIDINRSGTRKEELLIKNKADLSKMWILRRILNPMGPIEAMEFLIEKLKYAKTNEDFFSSMNS
ncbi:MAG: transcription termination factor Rho [Holosporales bacterium]|jgi:transcription termination factor Rho|nr:transcription termination factor Rho [Holosporales bacterium]